MTSHFSSELPYKQGAIIMILTLLRKKGPKNLYLLFQKFNSGSSLLTNQLLPTLDSIIINVHGIFERHELSHNN